MLTTWNSRAIIIALRDGRRNHRVIAMWRRVRFVAASFILTGYLISSCENIELMTSNTRVLVSLKKNTLLKICPITTCAMVNIGYKYLGKIPPSVKSNFTSISSNILEQKKWLDSQLLFVYSDTCLILFSVVPWNLYMNYCCCYVWGLAIKIH